MTPNQSTTPSPPKRLSTNAFLLFEQATRVGVWSAGKNDLGEHLQILVLARKITDENGQQKWQIAAYQCDKTGLVLSWRERYDVTGTGFTKTIRNLAFRITNKLVEPQLIENLRS